MKKEVIICLLCLCLGSLITWWSCKTHYNKIVSRIENAKLILISKHDMTLKVIDFQGNELFATGIACGKNFGNKRNKGDMKTPEGVFHIIDIQNATTWTHDFKDGKGDIKGAYGPYFIRLDIPGHKGIGIHGTHDSLSIKTRVTEGCIRLENNALKKLVPMLSVPMTVVITPSAQDEQTKD